MSYDDDYADADNNVRDASATGAGTATRAGAATGAGSRVGAGVGVGAVVGSADIPASDSTEHVSSGDGDDTPSPSESPVSTSRGGASASAGDGAGDNASAGVEGTGTGTTTDDTSHVNGDLLKDNRVSDDIESEMSQLADHLRSHLAQGVKTEAIRDESWRPSLEDPAYVRMFHKSARDIGYESQRSNSSASQPAMTRWANTPVDELVGSSQSGYPRIDPVIIVPGKEHVKEGPMRFGDFGHVSRNEFYSGPEYMDHDNEKATLLSMLDDL
jgi:hypothetical protein